MTPEEAFLEDIREHPDDDTPRLIFADWLEDHGDADRAEFIRTQIRLLRDVHSRHTGMALAERAEQLLQANWDRWVGPLHTLLRDGAIAFSWPSLGYKPGTTARFIRGFIERIEARTAGFVRAAPELFRLYPLRRLSLHEGAEGLAECEQLAWVERLEFIDFYRAPLDARGMARLAGCPYFRRLRNFYLAHNYLGDEGVAALAFAHWLPQVRELILGDNGLSHTGVEALATTPHPFRPWQLHLGDNPLGDEGVQALAESPILAEVASLGLCNCDLSDRAAVALARSPYLRALKDLDLTGNDIGDASRRALDEAPWRRHMRQLLL